ncbi:uncharacterized protein SPAPADRAFT_144330 [Spathaspora passalidarum NRRL Y-27907]|uniref:Uncharacterized protein n=1 Tax=Spathaspora passalidarum (strain NRRL Y-27907 / 11-Y1) TaxID=619300 RepID=G3AVM0_SPAPN|nr:uncharacterized protein SPAPADRAFT_144330 [Spathaspora passalidarum NRRL Y-27907]EGW30185.1 hypothetical protein SPAPADRAFT_144330 [Spathaspora passalidarum NRRL Y-27907]
MDKGEVEIPPKDEEELLLEKLVFGDKSGFESNLKKVDNLFDYSEDEEEDIDEGGSDQDIDGDDELGDIQDDDLFFIDEGDAMDVDQEEENSDEEGHDDESEDEEDEDNAWEDSDDEHLDISLTSSDRLRKLRKTQQDSTISGRAYITRLRSQFEKIYPRPLWADEQQEEVENSDDEIIDEEVEPVSRSTNALLNILSTTQSFIITKQLKLISPNRIAISRLKDANYQKYAKSAIQSISFHPTHPFLLTGGFDKTIRVYHIDGKANNFITSFFLKNCPIQTVQFAPPVPNGNNLIFAGGRRRYMNKIDLNNGDVEKISRLYGHEQHQKSFEYFKISSKGTYIGLTGNSGWCNILNGATGQYIRGFKIEGTIVDFEFANDESFIIIVNSAGEVWEYELGANTTSNQKGNKKQKIHNKILRKWTDDGGIGITKIKLGGPKNRWVAIGTNNGIVNIYDRNGFTETTVRPKPIKTVENLITSISSLVFNPDGQILCVASRGKRDALRLVHLPSGSVYSNWPTSGTPLGKVTSVAFSPNNEMLAIGNEAGKVTLWRLDHY